MGTISEGEEAPEEWIKGQRRRYICERIRKMGWKLSNENLLGP